MDLREQLNENVLSTAELELELNMLNTLAKVAVNEGVCMADVISYESLGKTDITEVYPAAFFSPERSQTGVELAGESFFASAADAGVKLLKTIGEFIIRIAKGIWKALTDVKTGSPYKNEAIDAEQFNQRIKAAFGNELSAHLLRTPAVTTDIIVACKSLAGAYDICGVSLNRIEKILREAKDTKSPSEMTKCKESITSIIVPDVEAAWHSAAATNVDRLFVRRDNDDRTRLRNDRFDQKKYARGEFECLAFEAGRRASAKANEYKNAKTEDVAVINKRPFVNTCPSVNDLEDALELVGESAGKYGENLDSCLKESREFFSRKISMDVSTDVAMSDDYRILSERFNNYIKYMRSYMVALGQCSTALKAIVTESCNLSTFLSQNDKHF